MPTSKSLQQLAFRPMASLWCYFQNRNKNRFACAKEHCKWVINHGCHDSFHSSSLTMQSHGSTTRPEKKKTTSICADSIFIVFIWDLLLAINYDWKSLPEFQRLWLKLKNSCDHPPKPSENNNIIFHQEYVLFQQEYSYEFLFNFFITQLIPTRELGDIEKYYIGKHRFAWPLQKKRPIYTKNSKHWLFHGGFT